ncbi:unnamed protein product, partial [Ceratitis capitata]
QTPTQTQTPATTPPMPPTPPTPPSTITPTMVASADPQNILQKLKKYKHLNGTNLLKPLRQRTLDITSKYDSINQKPTIDATNNLQQTQQFNDIDATTIANASNLADEHENRTNDF